MHKMRKLIFKYPKSHKINILFLLSLIIVANSCFKDDDVIIPLKPREEGAPNLALLETSIYETQTYYSLTTDTVISSNNKMIWDLGFEASDNGWHIILNAAKMMKSVNMGSDWDAVNSLAGINYEDWEWDLSTGDLDSTAINDWIDISVNPYTYTNDVYIINRGYDSQGNPQGYKKVSFNGLQDNVYTVRFADLNGNNENTVTVIKDPSVHFVALSFDTGETLVLEPDKDSWNLLFGQYTGITYTLIGEPFPYFVQGVRLNYGDGAIIDTTYLFKNIDLNVAESFEYCYELDTIGHLWKDVYVNTETLESYYECDTTRNHIIKTSEGEYYKLRFLYFYSPEGVKGYTSFEYQKL